MKKTRKIMAAVMSLAMVSALAPMTAFADTTVSPDTNGDPAPSTASFAATLNVAPTYTVTIPAGVTLSETEAKTASITASDVKLAEGKEIKVTLTEASNTESGTTFTAKNSAGTSSATYTISRNDNTVGLAASNNTLAEFTANGSQTLSFSKAEGASAAGVHTENLTFTISLADVSGEKTLAEQVTTENSVVRINFEFTAGGETVDRYVDYTYSNGTFTLTGKSESFSANGNWNITESNGVLTFTALYEPMPDESALNYSSTINLNDLTYSELNAPNSDAVQWYITLTNIEVNGTPVTITN